MMVNEEIFIKLKQLVLEITPEKSETIDINEETNLIADLGYTSIELIKLVVKIESELNFYFKDEYLRFETLIIFGKLYEYVCMMYDEKIKE